MSTETTITAPPTGDGLVRTLADVAGVVVEAGLRPTGVGATTTRWDGTRVTVRCWPSAAFQVAVYAKHADGDHAWTAIFDYETPADLIAHTVRRAQGATVTDDEPGDECNSCEGLVHESELDPRGLCRGCAHQADTNPWVVTEGRFVDGELRHVIVDDKPMSREMAEHRARIHNDSQRWKDRGTTRRAIRRADYERGMR